KSVVEQHVYLMAKYGMKRYLQNTLHMNKYNIIGGILLLPFFIMMVIDTLARVIQGDLFHYNRSVYAFLSHTPLYWFPVLFTWTFLFPFLAIVLNLIPIVIQGTRKRVHVRSLVFV